MHLEVEPAGLADEQEGRRERKGTHTSVVWLEPLDGSVVAPFTEMEETEEQVLGETELDLGHLSLTFLLDMQTEML